MDLNKYIVFGLKVESEIELPELRETKFEKSDVQIQLGKVPRHLNRVFDKGVLYESAPGDLIIKLAAIGAFRVQNGNLITIKPSINATNDDIRLFLLGSAFGALLHQRGVLPIHGSAVSIKFGALIISGNSAAGKSTLAESLRLRGFTIIADDISVVTKNTDGCFVLQPGIPHLKLWRDVLDHFKSSTDLERVRSNIEKYRKKIENPASNSHLVNQLIFLQTHNKEGFLFEKISGVEKINQLIRSTYRFQYVNGLGQIENHFKIISELASNTPITRIRRPLSPLLVDELTDLVIEKIINSNEYIK